METGSRVVGAISFGKESLNTGGRVVAAGRVCRKRTTPGSCVAHAGCVVNERKSAGSRVLSAVSFKSALKTAAYVVVAGRYWNEARLFRWPWCSFHSCYSSKRAALHVSRSFLRVHRLDRVSVLHRRGQVCALNMMARRVVEELWQIMRAHSCERLVT